MPSPEEISKLVHDYVDASNRNDKDTVVAMFAPDAVWFDPVGQPPHVGHDGVAAFWDQTRTMADRIEMILDDVIAVGSEAAMRFRIRATIGGNVMEMDGIETFEVDEDGLFTRVKAYWDMSKGRTTPA
jgi:ketosteroid isomerase-like protein